MVRGAEDYKIPDKEWAKGPVRWIMSDEEEKEFKRLRTDEERQAYAKSFWEKRDPTPGTPENEFKEIFWKRVEAADKSYTIKTLNKPGSMTDTGKVFLLLGPPNGTDRDSRNYITWTYEPSTITGITQKMELRFAPQQTGPLLLDRKEVERYVEAHPETRGIGWKLPVIAQAPSGEVPSAPAEEAKEDLSQESQRQIPILEAVLAKGSGPTEVPFSQCHDFYAAADGTTLAVITIESPRAAAHGAGDSALRPFARLAPQSSEWKPVNLTGDLPFVPAPQADTPPGTFVYQARRNLKPGAYRIASAVEDKVIAGQMGTLVQDVTVPDFSDKRFEMSSIALLAAFTPLEASVGPDEQPHVAGPYVLGGFRLVPRAIHTLAKSDALSYYYQVYNPVLDPATGRPSLEATYSFFLKEGGAWKPFRKPLVKPLNQVELYSIDLKDLLRPEPILPAEFKMQVKVADKIGGKTLEREVAFTVR